MSDTSNTASTQALSYNEVERISRAFVASKMFGNDVDRISVAITKVMAGQELGMAPFAAMRAINVIQGNATLSANTMAAMVKRSNHYDYEVKEKTDQNCVIDFIEIRGEERVVLGTETFDINEADKANLSGKDNWKKYPKAMLFARCISNGVRTYCPDVFNGLTVYTPDELQVIDGTPLPEDAADKPEQAEDGVDAEAPEETSQEPPETADEVPTEDEVEAVEDTAKAVPEPEPEAELMVVDSDMKEVTLAMIEDMNLSGDGRVRFCKETTGSLNPKMIKDDQKWRDLHDRAAAVLAGDEDIPEEWLVKEKAATK